MHKTLIIFCFIINSLFLIYALSNNNNNLKVKENWERVITIIFVFFNILGVFLTLFNYNKGFDIIHNIIFRGYYYLFAILFTSPLLLLNSIIVLVSTLLSWKVFNDKCIFNLFTKYNDSKILNIDKNYLIVLIIILVFKLHNISNYFIKYGIFIINLSLYLYYIYYDAKYLIR